MTIETTSLFEFGFTAKGRTTIFAVVEVDLLPVVVRPALNRLTTTCGVANDKGVWTCFFRSMALFKAIADRGDPMSAAAVE